MPQTSGTELGALYLDHPGLHGAGSLVTFWVLCSLQRPCRRSLASKCVKLPSTTPQRTAMLIVRPAGDRRPHQET